jgi:hypothetical protein
MTEQENIYEPLIGLQKAEPKPFLATRVKAALQKQVNSNAAESTWNWLLKPAILAAVFALVFAAHYTIWQQENAPVNEITEEVADIDLDMNAAFTNINMLEDEK